MTGKLAQAEAERAHLEEAAELIRQAMRDGRGSPDNWRKIQDWYGRDTTRSARAEARCDGEGQGELRPWVRCPWVSREGDGQCILRDTHEPWKEPHVYCGHPCPLMGDYCPECGVNGTEPPVDEEPAQPPQPGLFGPTEALRAEIVEALREVEAASPSRWFDALADRLERHRPNQGT